MESENKFLNYFALELLIARATDRLRIVFREQWHLKYNQRWEDSQQQGTAFVNGPGKDIHTNVKNIQKKQLKKGNTNGWDLTLVAEVIKGMKFFVQDRKSFQKNIDVLLEIRNKLAHSSSKEVSKQEFDVTWDRVSKVLLFLGDSEEELEIFKSSSTNLKVYKNVEQAIKLKEEGNREFKNKNYNKAIEHYTEAIVMPSVPDTDLAVLYSNRCACQMEKYKMKQDNSVLRAALEDAKNCILRYSDWAKGHWRLAKVYFMMDKFDKAIREYDFANNLDPDNKEILQERAEARKKKGEYERSDHLNPGFGGVPREKVIDQFHQITGLKLDDKQIDAMEKLLLSKDPVLKEVHIGHCYRDGSNGYAQDFSMAAKHYGLACTKGSPEAMYNLAKLTGMGRGVKQDFKLALALLKKAASHSAFDKNGCPVVGVAEAEHALGLCYAEGTYDEKSIPESVHWYEKAIEHGYGLSANNLGLMYMNGDAVKQDYKKAEKLLLFAVTHGDFNAMLNIAILYSHMGFPQKSLHWLNKAIESGSMIAESAREDIEKSAKEALAHLEKSGVAKWERENGLTTDDLSVMERMDRYGDHMAPGFAAFQKKMDESRNGKVTNPKRYLKNATIDFDLIEKHRRTSVTAVTLFDARDFFQQARNLLHFMITEEQVDYSGEIVHSLAKSYEIEATVVRFTLDEERPVKEIVKNVLRYCEQAKTRDALLEELEHDARLCYANLHADELEKTVNFLTLSIKKFPKSISLLQLRGCLYSFLGKNENSLKDFNEVLKSQPDFEEVIYLKAAVLRLLGRYSQAVEFYEKFLKICEKDHRKVPESYYAIGILLAEEKAKNQCSIEHLDSVVAKYYKLGLEAEKLQLPIYLPYKSTSKPRLEAFVVAANRGQLPQSPNKEPTLLEKKKFDPQRKSLIIEFRTFIKEQGSGTTKSTFAPPQKQKGNISLDKLKPLYLNEVDGQKDIVMKGYALSVTVIGEISSSTASLMFVVEDKNFDTQRVALYNFDRTSTQIKDLSIGSRFTIVNPYMRISADRRLIIRVDDPTSVVFADKVENACWCCGKANADKKCGRCKMATYCSKECQEFDWKEYRHVLTCGIKPTL